MRKHPYFKLYLHSNEELEPLLTSEIIERTCLHEWPLSSVELLLTRSGKKWIYKSQSAPSLETTFYARASSPLLVKAYALEPLEPNQQQLLLEYLPFDLLRDSPYSEHELLVLGRKLMNDIQNIKGDLPAYLDISSETKWLGLFENLIPNLENLIKEGVFQQVDAESLNHLRRVALGGEMARAFENPGYVHGDLSGNNVFVTKSGYKVIDWQRPLYGPIELDLSNLLQTSGLDPLKYLDSGVVKLGYILQIYWLSECTLTWFPEGKSHYDNQIEALISAL